MYINILLHINIFTDCNISAHICHFLSICVEFHISFCRIHSISLFVQSLVFDRFVRFRLRKLLFILSFRFVFVSKTRQNIIISILFDGNTFTYLVSTLYHPIINIIIIWIDGFFLLSWELLIVMDFTSKTFINKQNLTHFHSNQTNWTWNFSGNLLHFNLKKSSSNSSLEQLHFLQIYLGFIYTTHMYGCHKVSQID